jgi:hypothetical protein
MPKLHCAEKRWLQIALGGRCCRLKRIAVFAVVGAMQAEGHPGGYEAERAFPE